MVESLEMVYFPRSDWKKVMNVTNGVIEARRLCDNNLPPESMVFIGGIAALLHLYNTFGHQETMRWRGTEDVDVVIFGLGKTGQFIKALSRVPHFGACESKPSHFIDKSSCRVMAKGFTGYIGEEDSWVDIDLYGQTKPEGILLNERTMTKNIIIADPPEPIMFGRSKIPVYVPSVRDLLQLKFDILRYSQLRSKDWLDIVGCFAVAEKKGIKLNDLVSSIFYHIYHRDLKLKTVDAMRRFKQIAAGSNIFPPDWHKPSQDYVKSLEDYLPN